MKLASHSVIIQTGMWPRCCASHPKHWEKSHDEVFRDLRPRLWSHLPESTLQSLKTAQAVVHVRARAQGAHLDSPYHISGHWKKSPSQPRVQCHGEKTCFFILLPLCEVSWGNPGRITRQEKSDKLPVPLEESFSFLPLSRCFFPL